MPLEQFLRGNEVLRVGSAGALGTCAYGLATQRKYDDYS